LEQLLSLYQKVSRKTLRISKTLGLEGKQLLTPDDDYKALQDFNASYEGTESREEAMALEYQRLVAENPGYENTVKTIPQKIHSGKTGEPGKGISFCYELPVRDPGGSWTAPGQGFCKWYFVNLAHTGEKAAAISKQTYDIWGLIRCGKNTARALSIGDADFAAIRKTVESHISRSYMKAIQAPAGGKTPAGICSRVLTKFCILRTACIIKTRMIIPEKQCILPLKKNMVMERRNRLYNNKTAGTDPPAPAPNLPTWRIGPRIRKAPAWKSGSGGMACGGGGGVSRIHLPGNYTSKLSTITVMFSIADWALAARVDTCSAFLFTWATL
jgi:hypothetical protein